MGESMLEKKTAWPKESEAYLGKSRMKGGGRSTKERGKKQERKIACRGSLDDLEY